MIILSKLGLCPPLFGKFRNGLAYGCIPGKVFKVADMRDPHKMDLVAKKLAVWHSTVSIPGERTSKLFTTIQKWIKEGKQHAPAYQVSRINAALSRLHKWSTDTP
jgi:ethanolamine kinase